MRNKTTIALLALVILLPNIVAYETLYADDKTEVRSVEEDVVVTVVGFVKKCIKIHMPKTATPVMAIEAAGGLDIGATGRINMVFVIKGSRQVLKREYGHISKFRATRFCDLMEDSKESVEIIINAECFL